MLIRYRYMQPLGGTYLASPGSEAQLASFGLLYAGAIPASDDETTDDVLERLCERHSSELRPHERRFRPLGVGDVFDLGERGTWRVLRRGFELVSQELQVEAVARSA
jgi:hypothetical protein